MTVQLRKPRPVDPESVYTRTRTTLEPAARSCDQCAWPDRCRQDRLCWTAEKQAIAAERAEPAPIVWTRELIVDAIEAWVRKHGEVPSSSRDWCRAGTGHPSVVTVKRLFGNWSAAIEAAGYEPRRNGWAQRKPRRKK